MVFMLAVDKEYYSIQTPLICRSPVDDLDDYHMVKLIVYLVKLFEKENAGLFKGKSKGVPGPKFKYTKSEMLAFVCFCYF